MSKVGSNYKERKEFSRSNEVRGLAIKTNSRVEEKSTNPSAVTTYFKNGNFFKRVEGKIRSFSETPYKGAKSDALEMGLNSKAATERQTSDNYLLKVLNVVLKNENLHTQSKIKTAAQKKVVSR